MSGTDDPTQGKSEQEEPEQEGLGQEGPEQEGLGQEGPEQEGLEQEEPEQEEPEQEKTRGELTREEFQERAMERGKNIRDGYIGIRRTLIVDIPANSPVADPRWWTLVLLLSLVLTLTIIYIG